MSVQWLKNRRLYLVTDSAMLRNHSIESMVQAAVRGGAGIVQLREKQTSARIFIETAKCLKSVLMGTGIPLLINDRVDIALAAGVDGVHLGQSDMAYPDARRLLGQDAIIGLSVESIDQVLEANEWDVSYLGISPVFSTPTKTDTRIEWGLDGIRRIRALSHHRIVGIGGIHKGNAAQILAAGADAIAVVSAICASDDPESAARELCAAMSPI